MTHNLLDDLYRSPRIGLSGNVDQLLHKAKFYDDDITKADVQAYLWTKPSYQMLKPRKFKFSKEQIRVSGIDTIHTADLADVAGYNNFMAKQNENVQFLLLVVDLFSKYLWVKKLKSKAGPEVAKAFDDLYRESKRVPGKIWVDQGSEFYNRDVSRVLKKHNITLYSVISPIKSGPAERVVRTFKTRLYRYLMENVTWRYVDVLDDLVIGYNNTQHKTIKMAPASVRPRHTEELLQRINPQLLRQTYKIERPTTKSSFAEGDIVRPMVRNRLFQKSYWGTYWETLFKVVKVFRDRKPVRYQIESLEDGEIIRELFYAGELVPGTKQPVLQVPGESKTVIRTTSSKKPTVKVSKFDVSINKKRQMKDQDQEGFPTTPRTRSQTQKARK